MDTRVVASGLDISTATSLKELLESSGIDVEMTGEHESAFPGTPQFGGYGILVSGPDYAEARRLVDALELEAGQTPPEEQ